MLTQAYDYLEECAVLYSLLKELDEREFRRPTQFKGWTFNDVIGHLHLFDYAARLTLEQPLIFAKLLADIMEAVSRGNQLTAFTRNWLGKHAGRSLLMLWHDCARGVAEVYANSDPQRRVCWAGPQMSVRSCISARQMETWAHGQELFDALGRVRTDTDRIKNIAAIGVNTFGWTFINRRIEVPLVKPYVKLYAPSGAVWSWNDPIGEDRVEGSATEFCQVVTQTRNIGDTALFVRGVVAREWMSMAQCFAGAPEAPPYPGTRFRCQVDD